MSETLERPLPAPRVRGFLGERFGFALQYATAVHRRQLRKSTDIPYAGHLLGVCSTVIDAGGDEDEAISALLHDAPEDQGGAPRLVEIRSLFGNRVGDIVEHLSDSLVEAGGKKAPWKERKDEYFVALRACTDPSVYLVSAADKLHNLRAIYADYRDPAIGENIWQRFSTKNRTDVLWYYNTLLEIYAESTVADPRRECIVQDLRETMAAIERLLPATPVS